MSKQTAVARPLCGAHARQSGRPCRNPAGFKTPHPNQGRCHLHGGLSPVRHGRYSAIQREQLRDLIEKHEQDPQPLNLLPELAALRALFQDFIERYDQFAEALLAWHASWRTSNGPLPQELVHALGNVIDEFENRIRESGDPTEHQTTDLEQARKFLTVLRGGAEEGKPRQMLDLASASRILTDIGRMVERIESIRSTNAISRPDLNRIMHEMWRSVDVRVTDDKVKAAIREDWMRINL